MSRRACDTLDHRHMPQYTLYIRRRDRAMCLVEHGTGKTVQIEAIRYADKSSGVFVRPVSGTTGVYLMGDEVCLVGEFPLERRRTKRAPQVRSPR